MRPGLKERQDDYLDCWQGLRKHFNPAPAVRIATSGTG